jgi:CspA family cold shock protein
MFATSLPDIFSMNLTPGKQVSEPAEKAGDTRADVRAGTEPKTSKMTGRILRLLFGFGFLEDERGREWYFHRRSFRPERGWDSLRRGQKVSFEIGKNQRGPCAVTVRLVDQGKHSQP